MPTKPCCRGLAEGTAPVYFGMGSTPISPPAEIVEMIMAACAQLDQRLLICTGPNDLSEFERFDHVKLAGAVNHATILPGCQAAVHHGGAGTTAAAMRAGVPSLILWLWLDQPVWAAGVEQLKIGTAQRFSDVDQQSLTAGSEVDSHTGIPRSGSQHCRRDDIAARKRFQRC